MWKSHWWYQFHKKKKWRAETLQRGLEFGNLKIRLETGIFKCVSWSNCSFFVWSRSGISEWRSQCLSDGTMSPPSLFISRVYPVSSSYISRVLTEFLISPHERLLPTGLCSPIAQPAVLCTQYCFFYQNARRASRGMLCRKSARVRHRTMSPWFDAQGMSGQCILASAKRPWKWKFNLK